MDLDGRLELTRLPEYFLSQLSINARPSVVVCREGSAIVGVVYAYELLLRGFPTGWVFGGDEMGRGLVVCKPTREREILDLSCEHLVQNGIHAARLSWQCREQVFPGLKSKSRDLNTTTDIRYRPIGDLLTLPIDYQDFLKTLGSHTRRNLRYYRRKAEAMGIRYVPSLSRVEYEDAVRRLCHSVNFSHSAERSERDERFFELVEQPVLIGLRNRNGDYVSVLAAIQFGSRIHVLSQLNDSTLGRLSLSLVLRSYLLEGAIERGCRSIHFLNGISPMLGRYSTPVTLQLISVDKSNSVSHWMKLAAGRIAVKGKSRVRIPMRLRALLGQNFYGVWTLDEPLEASIDDDASASQDCSSSW
jgi:hypothetical protein